MQDVDILSESNVFYNMEKGQDPVSVYLAPQHCIPLLKDSQDHKGLSTLRTPLPTKYKKP